eukprot:comp23355_c0_seq1/m.38571 comp23355_c0_seq1/g.38571  ORF comp23355_c0_seq1/g.38571 comp23355_c0_seq1/m.38571 type:complete len:386 (-) comp23355_c0_seq1:801-1958(-)
MPTTPHKGTMNAVECTTEASLPSETHSALKNVEHTTCITDTLSSTSNPSAITQDASTNTQGTPRPTSPSSTQEITTPTVRKSRNPTVINMKSSIPKGLAAAAVCPASASSSATSAGRTPVTKSSEKTTPKATPTLAASRNNSITSTPDQKLDIYAFSTSVVIKPKSAHEIYRDSPKPGTNPKYAHVKAKVGSFDNIGYKSGGSGSGRKSIGSQDGEQPSTPISRMSSNRSNSSTPSQPDIYAFSSAGPAVVKSKTAHEIYKDSPKPGSSSPRYAHVKPRIDAYNPNYKPGQTSGKKVVVNHKIDLSHVKPKVGSLANINYTSKGGNVRYEEYKLDFKERAVSRINRGQLQKTPIKAAEKVAQATVTASSPAPEPTPTAAVEVVAQ